MLVIVGAVVVILSVLGGYLFEGGNLLVLIQPAELIIIGGAAVGSMLIATTPTVLKALGGQLGGLLGTGLTKDDFADLLVMLYKLFRQIQQGGVMSIESHLEKPAESAIFGKHAKFLGRHHSLDFLADSMKVIIVGGINAHDLDALMEEDLKVHHDVEGKPAAMLTKVGDAMPGLGIVAAVLGIVITMGAIDGPPSEIGEHVGAALVGTFLGILMSYGFIQPLAGAMEARVAADGKYEECMRAGIMAVYKGLPPAIAIEFARRVLPSEVRPSFDETEKLCRAAKSGPEAAAA
ncbi:MAG: flagellar motor stator protein MotA [Acidobacteria bacterium]|nr:flagellar motor stator protein MotA [Acidobacteriota bacterium]